MDPFTRIALDISSGKTKSQFAIPNGKYLGDLFFITDENHNILTAFCWLGDKWISENVIFNIEKD